MERSPMSVPSTPGGGTAGGGGGGGSSAAIASGSGGGSNTGSNGGSAGTTVGTSTASIATSKPSLGQQILRTLRPRPSAAVSPFMTSATASPMIKAEDSSASRSSTKAPALESFVPLSIHDATAVRTMTLADFQVILKDLRSPLPITDSEDRRAAVQQKLDEVRTLLGAIKIVTDAEETKAEEAENTQWSSEEMNQPGPPQAEVFKVCLLLLTQAKEGKLPLPLRLAICELATASVHLSDLRASRATKAARETRSGAPGSQSSKAPDADHPLANIDRAALYALVCHLSDNIDSSALQHFETRLPALPMQLKAIDCLTLGGRDVVSFPGLLEFLGDALQIVWKEMQAIRRLIQDKSIESSANEEQQTLVLEQLTMREWSVLSCLQLITSIVKYSFAKLDLSSVEDILTRVGRMLLSANPSVGRTDRGSERQDSTSVRESRRARSKSKERRPLTEGYDYYGLDVLDQSKTPSASVTPRGATTPRLGPRLTTSDAATIAPIALATVPPPSAVAAAAAAASRAQQSEELLILQESEVRSALKLVDSVLRFGFMPPKSVDSVTKMLCRILGYNLVSPTPGVDWTALATPILANILRSHCANASLRCARQMLVDVNGAEDIATLCGSVEFLRSALSLAAGNERAAASEDALAPSLSVPLLMPALSGALQRHIDVLDKQVLELVTEMLPLKEGRHLLSQQLTPDDWDMLLELPSIAKRHLLDFNFGLSRDSSSSQQKAQMPLVIESLLELIGRLRLASVQDTEQGKENGEELPWTPKLAALLLSLAPFLTDAMVIDLVQYYKVKHLCLPCTSDWIANIKTLVNTLLNRRSILGSGSRSSNSARQAIVQFLIDDVCRTIQDLPGHRSALLLEVILPLAQSSLSSETDAKVEVNIRRALIEAAVTAIITTGAASEDEAGEQDLAQGDKIFRVVVDLHCQMARMGSLPSTEAVSSPQQHQGSALPHVSFADPPGSHDHKPSDDRTHARNGSVNSLTNDTSANEAALIILSDPTAARSSKAIQSSLDLIEIFHRLTFSSPWVLLPTSRAVQQSGKMQRLVWETRARTACLTIFNELLALLKPIEGASTPVRLAILQWCVRLRTDGEHRVYVAGDMNDLILPAATTLGRAADVQAHVDLTSNVSANAPTQDRLRPRRDTLIGSSGSTRDGGREAGRTRSAAERSASRIRDASRERGRRGDDMMGSDSRDASRLRSPSRAPAQRRATIPDQPLWRIPEVLLFEVPPSGWRSDVVFTYMHPVTDETAHHHHHHRYASSQEAPVPLPISAYVATCIAILSHDKDWDLVSYLLCHLPFQLANKHLVCGPKAQKEVMALRQMLTTSILEQKFINQVTLSEDVKRSDVYAVAYGTLATLISYRALFSRSQQDELVEAFMAGLNKSSNTAQPCIRALTVACYELQKSINRHLPKMLVKMSTVMSSSTMSVHILEMIASIGSLPSLYANFTETDYRRIFGIALQYIQYHNQRSAEEDARASATAFTLSQYVIMLAYYNISLWFLIVKIGDRVKYVESIRKGLLLANEGRSKVADQTEVCFDFLARYTHSNAEPRPQKSFLNKIVKAKSGGVQNSGSGGAGGPREDVVSKHYLYGKGLMTVSSLDKAGWAEVLLRRPSGTTGLLCKLENVPVSRLPEKDGEKIDLPAALMMDRKIETPTTSNKQSHRAAWVRRKLLEHEMRRNERPSGPNVFSVTQAKPRSASFSAVEGGNMHGARFALKSTDVDAYGIGGDASLVSESGQLLEPESEELKVTMERVLAETGAHTTTNGQGNVVNASSSSSTTTNVSRFEHTVDPSFLALQLSAFPDVAPSSKPPILLPNEAWVQRMVRAVDLTPTVDFHRIGILYVGAGQSSEREILGNRTGSTRYAQFLRGIGDLITLRGQQTVYTGGLDTHNDDHGKYAYVWGDDICQIVYHTTTLMPNDEVHDPSHARKKALIGNDWVRIVWNEAGREYDFDTIKTQFNYINIIVSPNSRGGGELGSISASDTLFYRVSLQCIDGLPNFAPVGDGQLVSAAALPNFVRILALNCSLVSQIFAATNDRQGAQGYMYTSNWVSRLHHIERAKTKMENDLRKSISGGEKEEEEEDVRGGNVISAGDATAYDILRF